MGRQDYETETLIAIQERAVSENPDSGPDGAGFRTDGMAYTLEARSVPQAVAFNLRGRDGGAQPEADPDNLAALRAASGGSSRSYIAFSAKDHGADAMEDCSPTLRAGGHSKSHANAGVMPAVCFAENSRAEVRLEGGDGDRAGALSTGGGKPGQGVPMVASSAVRRLTPRECERLQGFPDGYTAIPWRGKSADECPDGPRYKALGNSMAVPCMRWIGERIAAVEAISTQAKAA
jgi:DNA (cytosine-5)-methyltransferase 1